MRSPKFKVVEVNDRQLQVWRSENFNTPNILPEDVTYPFLEFEIRKSDVEDLTCLLLEKTPVNSHAFYPI